MAMLYTGQRVLGLAIVEVIYKAIARRQRTCWNQHGVISPRDGHFIWSKGYYVAWALPLALAG